jgi:hypothetical protein
MDLLTDETKTDKTLGFIGSIKIDWLKLIFLKN